MTALRSAETTPRSAELIGDCASDPPLSATLRRVAVEFADELVYGLGLVAEKRRARRLFFAARHHDARAALAGAIARYRAKVELVVLPEAWPPALGAQSVLATELLRASDRARGRAERRFVTLAGAVARPCVLEVAPGATAEELVAHAGGTAVDDWVAVAGGAPAGRLIARDAPLGEADVNLVLILPQGHEVVRRLRTPLADWLLRAASACEGCRVCTDTCPPSLGGAQLEPHQLLWTLVSLRDDGVDLRRALACTGCGLCDAMCPSALSPRALVVDVRDRLRLAGAVALDEGGTRTASGLDLALLTRRLGLAPYDLPLA